MYITRDEKLRLTSLDVLINSPTPVLGLFQLYMCTLLLRNASNMSHVFQSKQERRPGHGMLQIHGMICSYRMRNCLNRCLDNCMSKLKQIQVDQIKQRCYQYFVTRLTRRVSLVEQELPTLPEHPSSPSVFSGVRVTRSLVVCVCFVDRWLSFCTFSFGHCVVCSSSIYGL